MHKINLTPTERRDLGQKMKQARKLKGLSQQQLADLVGLKVGTISKYEQGNRTPDIGMLIAVSKAIDWDISYLIAPDKLEAPKSPFDPYVHHYMDWLRHMGVEIDMAYFECEDDEELIRFEFRVDAGNTTYDITNCLKGIIDMSREHFLFLVGQLGREV